MNYLDKLEENGKPYSYIRIGEDYEDIERAYYFGKDDNDYSCDHLSLERYITIE